MMYDMKAKGNLTHAIIWLSAIIVVLFIIAPPLAYFCSSYQHMLGNIETEGKISAMIIMRYIRVDPYKWEFMDERLQDVLSNYPRVGYIERWRTLNTKNEVITESVNKVEEPFITRSFDLTNAGVMVGRLEISRSVRPLLIKAFIIGLFTLPFGVGAFLALYSLPIRRIYRVEEALMKSKQLLEKTFANLHDAIFIVDYQTGKIVDCNTAATKIFGYKREEILGQTTDLLHVREKGNEEFGERLKFSWDKGFLDLPEINMKRKDGTTFAAEHSMLPMEENGKMIGWVVVARDITDRKKIEEEFFRTEKLESLGLLAGGIAHDFNNLMTGVLGNISAIKSLINGQDKAYHILEDTERAAWRTKDLTLQLLTFSRGGAPIKTAASIVDLAKESAHLALSGSNVRCEFSIPDDILPVEIDEGQIEQVMDNLIINADQSMPEGGIIEIRFENIINAGDSVLPLRRGEYVKISIKDNGMGIAKEHLPRIFDPYFTTKQKGSGLGLATAYSVIKRHGGHISVESEVGVGTTFHIYLPATREKSAPRTTQEKILLHGKGNILVMDDKEVVRDAAKRMMSIIGYNVTFAKNGDEAIEIYREALQAGKPFDAVILDLTVPGGMGGKEAVRELLAIDPNARVIVSSGYSNDPVMSEYEKYGFMGLLEKPYRMQELRETLSRVIEVQS
jgi:two-component system cell cycle sensor histidine kinase/response regulator CckA